jgi:hypothetical protein
MRPGQAPPSRGRSPAERRRLGDAPPQPQQGIVEPRLAGSAGGGLSQPLAEAAQKTAKLAALMEANE